MNESLRHWLRAMVPFPLRRAIARLRSLRGIADLTGRWGAAGLHASISRHASARLWRQVRLGTGVIIDPGTHFHTNDNDDGTRIVIEDGSFVGRHCFFSAGESIHIGRQCNIGAACQLLAAGHAYDDPTLPYVAAPVLSYGRMRLGPNTWIGVGSTLLGGIEVGYGTVVAAGSVVRQSLPPLCLAGGQPARVLKVFDWPTRCWTRLPDDTLARDAALAHHLATIPQEADYVLQLKS
ncbi:acyltransferase [Comamonas sp. CAH-2]|uniref:acyltransferase n=1 Tax=Comamonas sp. CAH-2 TaxID=2605745 RepID=UPI0012AD7E12|nr:acyltransferase [Comamonas sp. CAH-2]MRT20022.1 acyltransferase [Comamonas sp. CAH-2]